MRKRIQIFFLLSLVSLSCLHGGECQESFVQEDEILSMENIIAATEKQLDKQKEILALMEEFKVCRILFMEEDHSKKHAARMVKVASTLLEKIQEHHLDYAFSSSYLKELALFASIASKKTVKSS